MNFLTGLVILVLIYSTGDGFKTTEITAFADGCPLEGTLQVGDVIEKINGDKNLYVQRLHHADGSCRGWAHGYRPFAGTERPWS